MLQALLGGLGQLANALGLLKTIGVNIGPVGNEVLKINNFTQTDIHNYESGQAVVLGQMSENGKPGTILCVMNGGPAAASVGL